MKPADSNWLYKWHMLIGTDYSTQPLKAAELLNSYHVQISRITSLSEQNNNEILVFIKNRNSLVCSPSFNKEMLYVNSVRERSCTIRAGKNNGSFGLNLKLNKNT